MSPLAEFDFRYSNRKALGVEDPERIERAIKGAAGKRLTYRRAGIEASQAGTARAAHNAERAARRTATRAGFDPRFPR